MWEVDHNSEHWRTDALELWCWRRLLSVPWTSRKSNQSILKEINTEYSLEGLVLELKPQYFGHLMQRADSLVKTLMLGKIEGKRRRERQRMRWLDSTTDSTDMNLSKLQEIVEEREAWHAAVHGARLAKSGHDLVTGQQQRSASVAGDATFKWRRWVAHPLLVLPESWGILESVSCRLYHSCSSSC